jgi:DNA-binding response OmpR family regulator
VRRALENCAEIHVASSQSQARTVLRDQDFDLLIVDVSLPDGDGFGLCATVLAAKDRPRPRVLFLTGKGTLADKLTGFSVGGDDYLVKPIDPLELRARVEAQLRHCREAAIAIGQSSRLHAGNLYVDLGEHRATVRGAEKGPRELALTPTEFKLLLQLLRRESQVLSREQLLEGLNAGKVHVTDRTVDAHLCRLRRKLETAASSHNVEPVYGVGYRLIRTAA